MRLYRKTTATTTPIRFYVSHFKSHSDTSINKRALEIGFEVEQQCGFVGTCRQKAVNFCSLVPCFCWSFILRSIYCNGFILKILTFGVRQWVGVFSGPTEDPWWLLPLQCLMLMILLLSVNWELRTLTGISEVTLIWIGRSRRDHSSKVNEVILMVKCLGFKALCLFSTMYPDWSFLETEFP